MSKPAAQELLPPERTGSTQSDDRASLLSWLVEPLPDRLLLPLAGLWILGLDWLLFAQESVTLGLTVPVTAVLGFLLGGAGVYQFQRRFARDDRAKAGLKALLAGIVVGIPIPVAGTVVGAWILASSGLIHLRDRFFRGK